MPSLYLIIILNYPTLRYYFLNCLTTLCTLINKLGKTMPKLLVTYGILVLNHPQPRIGCGL